MEKPVLVSCLVLLAACGQVTRPGTHAAPDGSADARGADARSPDAAADAPRETSLSGDGAVGPGEQCVAEAPDLAEPACGALCGNQTEDRCEGPMSSRRSESCDGAPGRGLSCTSLGFTGGTLGCTSSCRLDVTRCDRCVSTFYTPGCGVFDTGGTAPQALALAAGPAGYGLLWAAFPSQARAQQPSLHFSLLDPSLRTLRAVHCFGPADARALSLVSAPWGWLVTADGAARGGWLASLDATGTLLRERYLPSDGPSVEVHARLAGGSADAAALWVAPEADGSATLWGAFLDGDLAVERTAVRLQHVLTPGLAFDVARSGAGLNAAWVDLATDSSLTLAALSLDRSGQETGRWVRPLAQLGGAVRVSDDTPPHVVLEAAPPAGVTLHPTALLELAASSGGGFEEPVVLGPPSLGFDSARVQAVRATLSTPAEDPPRLALYVQNEWETAVRGLTLAVGPSSAPTLAVLPNNAGVAAAWLAGGLPDGDSVYEPSQLWLYLTQLRPH